MLSYFLLLCFCFKNLDLIDWQTTLVRFFSEYFVCHFYFLWPKIMCKVFTSKIIRCSRSFSNFYRFYFWLCAFYSLYFGKIFLAYCFNSFDFVTATIFSKSSVILSITSFTAFFAKFCHVRIYFAYKFKKIKVRIIGITSKNFKIMLFKHAFCFFMIVWVIIFMISFITFNGTIIIFKPNIWFSTVKFFA